MNDQPMNDQPWHPANKPPPSQDMADISEDVLGRFENGKMMVVCFDHVVGEWEDADEGAFLLGPNRLTHWRILPTFTG